MHRLNRVGCIYYSSDIFRVLEILTEPFPVITPGFNHNEGEGTGELVIRQYFTYKFHPLFIDATGNLFY